MTVRVLFFGSVAERLGRGSAEAEPGITLSELVRRTGCADMQPLLLAVNQEQIRDTEYVVKDGDEVALMPPFSGG